MTPIAITGSGGLIGSESVHHFAGLGSDLVGIENDMRTGFFGPDASTQPVTDRRTEEVGAFRSLDLDIREAAGAAGVFDRHARHRADCPHRGAAVARLGRVGPSDRLRRQRQRHAEPAAGRARALSRRDVHLLLDQQGLRRSPEPPAAGRDRHPGSSSPEDHHWYGGIDIEMPIDLTTHSL